MVARLPMDGPPDEPALDPGREPGSRNVTRLLRAAEEGEPGASDALLGAIHDELRQLARGQLRRAPSGETLQVTALVNEAYLRLLGRERPDWSNRRQFFFHAARAMHDVLVEEARRKASRKRGGDWKRADPARLDVACDARSEDLLALSEALGRLEKDDPRKAEIVRLRFFAGLSEEETAEVLGVAARTVRREWRYIRARLYRELENGGSP